MCAASLAGSGFLAKEEPNFPRQRHELLWLCEVYSCRHVCLFDILCRRRFHR